MVEETTQSEAPVQDPETQPPAPETTTEPPQEAGNAEVVVTIGDAPPQEEDAEHVAPWVRDLRKHHRDAQRENRELRAQLEQVKNPAQSQTPTVGPRPTIEEFDYDPEKYDGAVDAWYEKKKAVDNHQAQLHAHQAQAAQKWQAKLTEYQTLKTALGVKDFETVEETVANVLDPTQQGIILHGATNPALLVYALGRSPEKLASLAQIKDPVKFTMEVARLEMQVKTTTRKPPPPEKIVTSGGVAPASKDATLEKLRAEADRTGDYSRVVAYKSQKARKS